MQLRVARHTDRLEELVAFYRDGIGLPELGGFRGHAGYDGVFLALPGTQAHLELTAGGGHGAPTPHPESLLVLYLGDEAAVREVVDRLGVAPVAPANPYWAEHGVTVEDPDGFRVVLVPAAWQPAAIRPHTGQREELRPLFELAEDSASELDRYLGEGTVLVAEMDGKIAGHVQITDTIDAAEAEIKNMAVVPAQRGTGLGRALVTAAIDFARREGRATLVVATAAAGTGNLRFYQRLGFRMRSVERDAFTEATGYPPGLEADGVELRDRVWLDRDL